MKKFSSFKLQAARRGRPRRLAARNSPLAASGGFTLIETLVAVTILMVAIAGPLTIAEKGLSASVYAKDQLMASYLAQDALESIRNQMDTNELALQAGNVEGIGGWLYYPSYQGGPVSDLSASCTAASPCTIDTVTGGANSASLNACYLGGSPSLEACPLYVTSQGYEQGSPSNTDINEASDTAVFTRTFYLQPFALGSSGGPDNAANVVVTVTWPGDAAEGGGLTLEDTIFNVLQ